MGSIIRSSGKVFNSLLCLNLRLGFDGLKYFYWVISVKIDPLPGNTKNRESTRSWTARVRFVHPWADRMAQNLEIISITVNLGPGVPGFSIYYLVQIVNPMGRILLRWKSFFSSEFSRDSVPPYLHSAVYWFLYFDNLDSFWSSLEEAL